MKVTVPSFAQVIHTPYVIGKGDNPMIVCAGGEHSRAMDIWLVCRDETPRKLIDAYAYEASCACGPWVVEEGERVAIYCTMAYTRFFGGYRIAKFIADDLRGPYTLVSEDVLNLDKTYHSPCIIGDYMYFIMGSDQFARANLVNGIVEPLQRLTTVEDMSELFRPSIYRTGPDQLCMFLTEIMRTDQIRVGVFTSIDGTQWHRVGELTPGTSLHSYKPALYKGNLVRVGRDTPRATEGETSWFEFEHIKLSEISPVFTDFPYDYYFPDFIL